MSDAGIPAIWVNGSEMFNEAAMGQFWISLEEDEQMDLDILSGHVQYCLHWQYSTTSWIAGSNYVSWVPRRVSVVWEATAPPPPLGAEQERLSRNIGKSN